MSEESNRSEFPNTTYHGRVIQWGNYAISLNGDDGKGVPMFVTTCNICNHPNNWKTTGIMPNSICCENCGATVVVLREQKADFKR